MNVKGNRVYVLRPNFKNYDFTLDPKTQRELEDEELAKFDKLKVFAIGDTVNNNPLTTFITIKVGDLVYIDPKDLRQAVHIKIDDTFVMSVSGSAIMHIW